MSVRLPLAAARLELRAFEPADVDAMLAAYGDAEVMRYVTDFGVGAYLDETFVRTGVVPVRAAAMVTTVQRLEKSGLLDAIGIWTPKGTFKFGTLPPVGPKVPEVARAYHGETVSEIRGDKLVVELPLIIGSSTKPVGVVIAVAPYAGIRAQISRDTRRLYLLLLGGLALLWATLFPIVAGAARRLRRQSEENERLARHDMLTGLPNRMRFQELLEESRGLGTGVIVVDLDRFKAINDEYGHHVGDLVLQAVASRLRRAVRQSDVVARIGGDEFAVVVASAPDEATLDALARRIVAAVAEPLDVDALTLHVCASVGASARHIEDPDELVRLADAAMYGAKGSGGDAHRVDVAAA